MYLCNKPTCLLSIGCCKGMGLQTVRMVGALEKIMPYEADITRSNLSSLFYCVDIYV
jgi:hypothetical protein